MINLNHEVRAAQGFESQILLTELQDVRPPGVVDSGKSAVPAWQARRSQYNIYTLF